MDETVIKLKAWGRLIGGAEKIFSPSSSVSPFLNQHLLAFDCSLLLLLDVNATVKIRSWKVIKEYLNASSKLVIFRLT